MTLFYRNIMEEELKFRIVRSNNMTFNDFVYGKSKDEIASKVCQEIIEDNEKNNKDNTKLNQQINFKMITEEGKLMYCSYDMKTKKMNIELDQLFKIYTEITQETKPNQVSILTDDENDVGEMDDIDNESYAYSPLTTKQAANKAFSNLIRKVKTDDK